MADGLRELRKRAGFSMADLALLAGYKGSSSYQRYENSSEYTKEFLPLDLVKRLARHLIGAGTPPIEASEVFALAGVAVTPSGRLHPADLFAFPQLARENLGAFKLASEIVPIDDDGRARKRDLPVYASAQGGAQGIMMIDRHPIDWVQRPEQLLKSSEGFGFHVVGDSMEPAFEQGDLALVNPIRAAGRGDDVLLVKTDRDDQLTVMLKRLVSFNRDRWIAKQWNPPLEFELPRSEWQHAYTVFGRYRR